MTQERALDILKAGKNVYLTGAAGSGKTHVLNEFIEYLKHRGVVVGVTASTGIAATHIGGVTIHSWSGIGVREYICEADIESLTQKEYLWKRFDKTKVLIIDEVSMISPEIFDGLDRLAKTMKGSSEPFGGMQVVLSGDFFQLPPIHRGVGEVQYVPSSRAWGEMDVRVCYLNTQYRQEDPTLLNVLNEIRSGEVTSDTHELLNSFMNEDVSFDVAPTRLYTHNVDVDALNQHELDKLGDAPKIYSMGSKGRSTTVDSLKRSVLAPEELALKEGAVVMFVRNGFAEGYVNGTLGVVESLEETHPVVRTSEGKLIHAHPVEWSIEEDGKVKAAVSQVPLRLAWAITIHKSQGMSMDAAEIDLGRAFVAGQGYVALSRLRTLKGLHLTGLGEKALSIDPRIVMLDKHLIKESDKWSSVLERFTRDQLDQMHAKYVLACGGTMDEKEIEQNAVAQETGERVLAHEKTKIAISPNDTLHDLARKRGVTTGTIIGHLEKLKVGDATDISQFAPAERDLRKIEAAFKKAKTKKLSLVRRILDNEYSFDELRLARIFIR